MKHLNPGNMWAFDDIGIFAMLDFGKYRKETVYIPIQRPLAPSGTELVDKTFALAQCVGAEEMDYVILCTEDTTNRLFLTTGVQGGFRGGVDFLFDHCTCTIVTSAIAGNKCESAIRFAAIFEPGQQLIIRSWNRHDESTYHLFRLKDDSNYSFKIISEAEWKARAQYGMKEKYNII